MGPNLGDFRVVRERMAQEEPVVDTVMQSPRLEKPSCNRADLHHLSGAKYDVCSATAATRQHGPEDGRLVDVPLHIRVDNEFDSQGPQ